MVVLGSRRIFLYANLAGAVVLIVLIYHVSFYWTTIRNATASFKKPISIIDGTNKVPPPHGTGGLSGLRDDAHTISSPDEFKSHFEQVLRLPNMTVAKAKSTCAFWPEVEIVNFQYGKDQDWVVNERNDSEIFSERSKWQDFVQNQMKPWEEAKDHYSGRGIVIVAGNELTMKRARIVLNQLKALKSKLPVEVHYWRDELTAEAREEFSTAFEPIYFNDLNGSHNLFQSNHNEGFFPNYQYKSAAMMNSRFAEPFLLDSDNVPAIDPAELYDSKTYKEYGTLFWPDIARTRPQNPMWAVTNTPCSVAEFEQESGQLLIDKRKFYYHLQLAYWFNKQRYYESFLLGDKDMFRFAWHALKTAYGRPYHWLTSVGTVNPTTGQYCGHSFGQHYPDKDDSRIAFLHGGLLKTYDYTTLKYWRAHGGLFSSYKDATNPGDASALEHTDIIWENHDYAGEKHERVGWCTEMRSVTAAKFSTLVPGFEKQFKDAGGYFMIEAVENGYRPSWLKSDNGTEKIAR